MFVTWLVGCGGGSDCAEIGGVAGLVDGPRTILVGEMHGTVETPALAGELACHAAAAGRPVVLALEVPRSEQERLEAALAVGDRAGLLAGAFWTGHQDGRNSAAMADLVLRMHGLVKAGKPVRITAFDVEPDPTLGASRDLRDVQMADALSTVRGANPDAVVVALTGNLHGRRTGGLPWDPAYRTMGSVLAGRGPVFSLVVRGSHGAAWNCQSDGCGPHPFGDPNGAAIPPVVHTLPQLTDGYDAEIDVGRFTPSAPAVSPAP
ncbi:MAG: hypothetical protein ABMA64_25770 [Myxococcota bacterium]